MGTRQFGCTKLQLEQRVRNSAYQRLEMPLCVFVCVCVRERERERPASRVLLGL
jgi:hypothetical protein